MSIVFVFLLRYPRKHKLNILVPGLSRTWQSSFNLWFCLAHAVFSWFIQDFFGDVRFFRHPGYLGFLIWSVGSQVLLCNPVCTVGYTIVMWRFFRDRIPYPSQFAHPVYFCTMWHIFMLQMSTEWHEYSLKYKCGNSVGLGFRVSPKL